MLSRLRSGFPPVRPHLPALVSARCWARCRGELAPRGRVALPQVSTAHLEGVKKLKGALTRLQGRVQKARALPCPLSPAHVRLIHPTTDRPSWVRILTDPVRGQVRDEINRFLEDDSDMRDMYLTRKAQVCSVRLRVRSVRSLSPPSCTFPSPSQTPSGVMRRSVCVCLRLCPSPLPPGEGGGGGSRGGFQ